MYKHGKWAKIIKALELLHNYNCHFIFATVKKAILLRVITISDWCYCTC